MDHPAPQDRPATPERPVPRNPRAEDVIAFVDAHTGRTCASCDARLIGHDAVMGLFLGFRDAPRCIPCLAAAHAAETGAFLERGARSIRPLDCYRAGWAHADRQLDAAGAWPEERVPSRLRMDDDDDFDDDDLDEEDDDFAPGRTVATANASANAAPNEGAATFDDAGERWDAGDKGCGELVLTLKVRLSKMEPDALLHLTATDPGAREDIPAWCRLTGHRLERAEPPHFLIARRP